MSTIKVDVVSAEEEIFSGDAEFVALPGEVGELGILPQHTPLISLIKPGFVRITMPETKEVKHVFVAGGVIEVQPHQVTVLADTAVRSEDLDHAKVEKAIAQAREARKNASGAEAASLDNELALLVAQLAAIKKLSMH
ncbi:MAG: F0F1 ATP synthase subunit epsilon [Burkholderiaceae bacterium]|nr:F0F1 ATP synthase subunit epsilon [Burkholderiaceae bacterium]